MSNHIKKRLQWIKLYERTGDASLVCRRCGISRPDVEERGQLHWLFEQNSNGYQQTRLGSRAPRRIENFYFAAQGGRCVYTMAWRSLAEV